MSSFVLDDGRHFHFYIPEPTDSSQVAWSVIGVARLNPYRTLGVFANTAEKERHAAAGRMQASLSAGFPVKSKMDVINGKGRPKRTAEDISRALEELALPVRQFRSAAFWFFEATPQDSLALEKLSQGDHDAALQFWRGAEGISARHNLALCLFFCENAEEAVPVLQELYAQYPEELGRMVNAGLSLTEEDWVDGFLSALRDNNVRIPDLLVPWVTRPAWQDWLCRFAQERLGQLLEEARSGETPRERYHRADESTGDMFRLLSLLEEFRGKDAPLVISLADEAAAVVMEAAIQHFRHGGSKYGIIIETESLLARAGNMAGSAALRERCQKNHRAAREARMELPSCETGEEGEAICKRVKALEQQVVTPAALRLMLQEVEPLFRSLHKRLGAQHAACADLAAMVVRYTLGGLSMILGKALGSTPEPAENVKATDVDNRLRTPRLASLPLASAALLTGEPDVKKLLNEAWALLRSLDTYPMNPRFRQEVYEPERASVELLCRQAGVQVDEATGTLVRGAIILAVLMAFMGLFWWLAS